jgi:superfamily II DNA or RNA helicase
VTEPEFTFSGLQQSEAILLQGLITRVWRGKSNSEQDERLLEIQYRFSTPDLDRRWNGILAEEREVFAVIHHEFSKEKWINLKDIYQNFRSDFSQYEIEVGRYEQESRAAEEVALRLRAIEAERIAEAQAEAERLVRAELTKKAQELKLIREIEEDNLKRAQEKKITRDRVAREIIESQLGEEIGSKELARRKKQQEFAEKLRAYAQRAIQAGRIDENPRFDLDYVKAILPECKELAIDGVTSGDIEGAISQILHLILDGNPNSRGIQKLFSNSSEELMLTMLMIYLGKAHHLVAPHIRGRLTKNGPKIDQAFAYQVALIAVGGIKQALDFSSYFPAPSDILGGEILIAAIDSYAAQSNSDVSAFTPLIIANRSVIEMEPEFIAESLKYPTVGDWRQRFNRWLEIEPENTEEILKSAALIPRELLLLVHNEFLAQKGNLAVIEKLITQDLQSNIEMQIVPLSPFGRNEYISTLIKSGLISDSLSSKYLLQDGTTKDVEILKKLFSFQALSKENFINVIRGLKGKIPDSELLANIDLFPNYLEDDEIWEIRKDLFFTTQNYDGLILMDAEREFTSESDMLKLALLSIQTDEYQACRQILERQYGKFDSILDLEAFKNMDKSELIHFLPHIVTYEEVTNLDFIFQIVQLDIDEDRQLSAAQRLRPLIKDGNAQAAALMLKANVPNANTPFEELELAMATTDLELRVVAIREIAKRYAHMGNMDMAREYAGLIAADDIESAYLLATVVQDDFTAHWALEVLYRTNAEEQQKLKAALLSYGFSGQSELEDYNLHKYLISPKEKKSQRQSNPSVKVAEDWYCRKSLLLEATKLQSDSLNLSYDFSSCRVHDIAFKQRVKFGFRIPSQHIIDHGGIEFLLQDTVPRNLKGDVTPSMQLILDNLASQGSKPRDWQVKAFAEWVIHGRRGMVEAVTGSGKSILGALAAAEALDDGYAVLIVVPTQILCDQWIEGPLKPLHDANLINKIGNVNSRIAPDTKVVAPGKITVAVMKSIVDNQHYLPGTEFDSCIIADEIHNYGGPDTSKVLGGNFRRRLGMTATLSDSESLGLFKNYFSGDSLYEYDFKTAVEDKAVCHYDLVMIGVQPNDLEKDLYTEAEYQVRVIKNEIIEKFRIPRDAIGFERGIAALENAEKAAELVTKYKSTKKRADSIIANSQSKLKAVNMVADFVGKRGNTIVFSDVNSNARNVQQILSNEGVIGEVVNSEVLPNDRKEFIQKLADKKLSALISPKALDEGIDIKGLTVGLFVGVQGQRRRLIQRLGRVLRVQDGKSKPVVIIPFNIGSSEDPNIDGNEILQLGKFDFVGQNADSIYDFHVNQQSEIKGLLNSLI